MESVNVVITGVGRLVAGDIWAGSDDDGNGGKQTIKTGANQGQPRFTYYAHIAIPKTDPKAIELVKQIQQVAQQSAPNLFDAQGGVINKTLGFAFKYIDGDSTDFDLKNNRQCDKEGYPGNYIFKFSNGFAPRISRDKGNTLLTDPNSVKRGYYVQIAGSVKGNGNIQKPGVYLNFSDVLFVREGEEINSRPAASSVFADAAETTTEPTGAAAVFNVLEMSGTAPEPDRSFLNGAPAIPVLPPAQPDKESFMTAKAKDAGYTYKSFTAAKWTEAQMIENGYMEPSPI